jgi:hypothetical protein
MDVLSQAGPLGGLHRASPVPFRGSYFTSRVHPQDATPQRLIACLYRRRRFPLIPSPRFVAHYPVALLLVRQALAARQTFFQDPIRQVIRQLGAMLQRPLLAAFLLASGIERQYRQATDGEVDGAKLIAAIAGDGQHGEQPATRHRILGDRVPGSQAFALYAIQLHEGGDVLAPTLLRGLGHPWPGAASVVGLPWFVARRCGDLQGTWRAPFHTRGNTP